MKGIVKYGIDLKRNNNWLYVIIDVFDNDYFIMEENYYTKHKLKSPITKREIDTLLKGRKVDFDFQNIGDLKIVIKVFSIYE